MAEAAIDPAAMPRVALPGGVEAPAVGLGTWELTGRACERAVRAALEAGYRHIDTAEAYGNEERIGRALAGSGVDPAEVFITTKVFHDHLRHEDVLAACEASLGRLGVDAIDLYLIHWPRSAVPLAETVAALKELRSRGRIRAWGVSNFTGSHLRETLEHGRPAVNQVELHPYFVQRTLEAVCRELEVPVTAYCPLARGRVADDPTLSGIGGRHGKTPAQVALRWSLQKGHAVIPKSGTEAHLRENLRVFDFRLADEEMERIDGLDEGLRIIDPHWSEFDR